MIDLYAEVIINSDAVQIDRPFTYKVRDEDNESIQVGHRVKVPFGNGNRSVEGFVIGLKCDGVENIKRIKKITCLLDKEPILSRDDLKLINFLRDKYLCKYIDGIRTIIPVGLMSGLTSKKKRVIVYLKDLNEELSKKENYVFVMNFIKEHSGMFIKSELINDYGLSSYSINKLIEKGYLSSEEQIVNRYNLKSYKEYKKNQLNEEQKNVFEKVLNSDKKGFLIKGVTGSENRSVYEFSI